MAVLTNQRMGRLLFVAGRGSSNPFGCRTSCPLGVSGSPSGSSWTDPPDMLECSLPRLHLLERRPSRRANLAGDYTGCESTRHCDILNPNDAKCLRATPCGVVGASWAVPI
uniref:Uncharacterized protein n=1 Tax=Globodera rostochiensis TaxID=31243 RepID=A0A914HVL7_GLORO